MFQVFIKSRRLSDAYPALLSFLEWANESRKIHITLFLNSITDHGPNDRILDLFPEGSIDAIYSPISLKNCNNSYTEMNLQSFIKYKNFLKGSYGDCYENDIIFITDDDLYYTGVKHLQTISNFPCAPELFPKYKDNAGEFDRSSAKYWDFYGITIKGLWLDILIEGLRISVDAGLKVGSGPLSTAYMCAVLRREIKILSNIRAFSTKKENSKDGILEESFNYLILKANEGYEKR